MNNIIAEWQFNLSQLYLHDNLSELLTFEMENIPHLGKTNGSTTVAARDVPEKRMRAYMQLFHTVLLQEVRKKPW